MLSDTLLQTVRSQKLMQKGDLITVALSGGGDSVALTHLLYNLRETLGISLAALHIHHGIRTASDREQKDVEAFCRTLNIALTVRRIDAPAYAAAHHIGLEPAARELRYQIFEDYLTEHGGKIATAHHFDDTMETFLINLARGCGTKGLCAIPFERDGIIRPLLEAQKTQITQYLQEQHLPYCTDESNEDCYYLRNFLRHEVLPLLLQRKDIHFSAGFAQTLQNLREEEAFLQSAAAPYLKERRTDCLKALAPPILWRVLKAQCPTLTRRQFERISEKLGHNFIEPLSGVYACEKDGVLAFQPPPPARPSAIEPQALKNGLQAAGKTVFINFFEEINNKFTNNVLDCDKITSELFVRSRKPGDRITLQRRGVSKTLKKLFCEDKVKDREQRIIIADQTDQVLFVEGYGVHSAFAPTKQHGRFMEIDIRKNKE